MARRTMRDRSGRPPAAILAAALALSPPLAKAAVFDTVNLVTNDQAAHSASLADGSLVNAWGVSYGPTGPFWVSDNGTGLSTLYSVNPATDAVSKIGLTVAIPGEGSVTGQSFNAAAGSGAFHADNFLFVSEDGTVSGWRGALGTAAETLQPGSSANVYKGTATAAVGGHSYLYSTNFRSGAIDVLKGDASAPSLSGSFSDPGLPAGYAPFNIEKIGDKLFVTYAQQNALKHDDVAGAGHGFVDAYDLSGHLLGRIASGGTLNSPWGLAVAPASFGSFAGDLLVGNFGDGRINAFSLATDSFVGQLSGPDGAALSIEGLWGIIPGNGGAAGSSSDLFFTAGPDGESNGLFGAVLPVPEPFGIGLLATGLGALGLLRRRS